MKIHAISFSPVAPSVKKCVYQKTKHFIFHVDNHLVCLSQIFVRSSAFEPEETHASEIAAKFVLFSLEIADLFAKFTNLQRLKRRHLLTKNEFKKVHKNTKDCQRIK